MHIYFQLISMQNDIQYKIHTANEFSIEIDVN